jgi:hypothetical protein
MGGKKAAVSVSQKILGILSGDMSIEKFSASPAEVTSKARDGAVGEKGLWISYPSAGPWLPRRAPHSQCSNSGSTEVAVASADAEIFGAGNVTYSP